METSILVQVKSEPIVQKVLDIIHNDFMDEEVGAVAVPAFNFDDVNKIKSEPAVDYFLELPEEIEEVKKVETRKRKAQEVLEPRPKRLRRSKEVKKEVDDEKVTIITKKVELELKSSEKSKKNLRNQKIEKFFQVKNGSKAGKVDDKSEMNKKESEKDEKKKDKVKKVEVKEAPSKKKAKPPEVPKKSPNSASSPVPSTSTDANPQAKPVLQTSTPTAEILKTANKFECDICFKHFRTRVKLYFHSRTHLPKVDCKVCGRKIQAYLMNRHMRNHRTNKPFQCDLCGASFLGMVGIRNHMYQHMSIKKFYCDICGRGYNDNRHLREHKLAHTNPAAYRCDLCPKGYERKQALEAHMQGLHMKNSKVYECDICGYKTKIMTVIYSHKKRHDKDVPCDECGKKFANKSELQDHVLAIHVNVKNVECKICGKFYTSKRYVLKHIRRTHGDPKKFKCEICESTYKSIDALKQHMKKHNTSMAECEICKRKVKETYLKRHQMMNAVCREKLKKKNKKSSEEEEETEESSDES